MGKGDVICGLDVGVGDVGVVHAERRENPLANVIVPGSASDSGDDLSGGHVEQIVVGVVTAETGGGLHEAQFVDNFFARVGGGRAEEQTPFPESNAPRWGGK